MNVTYWPFIRKMANMFNLTGNVTLSTMATLNSDIDCDQYLGRKIPANFTAEDQRNLKHIDSWYKQLLLCKNLSKAMTKNRFTKILSVFDSRIANPNQPLKWTFLSGHDTDLIATYTELNLSTSQCVEELYRKGTTQALNCEQYP